MARLKDWCVQEAAVAVETIAEQFPMGKEV